MATVESSKARSAEELLTAVQQLPAAELGVFAQAFAAWQEEIAGALDDGALLAAIRRNSALPNTLQRRFDRLQRKQQLEQLTAREQQSLQQLWGRVERMTAARLQALAELARRRCIPVRTLMRQLGITEQRHVV